MPGHDDTLHIWRAGYVCVCIGTGFLSVAGVCIYVFRDSIGYLFVSSDKVAAMVSRICPIAAAYQLPDGILGTIGGVLRCARAVWCSCDDVALATC